MMLKMAIDVNNAGNKIIFCGNGGSAADSQHLMQQNLLVDIK